jgi:SWI/SNF-related matrix-associated actin-dependent regulator of chromatin subfamily A protein 2/4
MIVIFGICELQRMSKLEEEEKNQAETRKRKFFTEILNAAREYQLQSSATYKRRKQRNDGVLVWFDMFCYFKISKQEVTT